MRYFRILAVLLVVVTMAAACGSDAESTSTLTDVAPTAAAEDHSDEDHAGEDHSAADDSGESAAEAGTGLDPTLFFDGALAEEITTEACTLSEGATATCYRITVAGYPADGEIGPFCPTTTSTPADDAGIWFDGEGLYDLDGQFILDLAELYGDDGWMLYDEEGNVDITETQAEFEGAAVPNVAEEFQNQCIEGKIEWLDGGEPIPTTVLIPTEPVAATSTGHGGNNLGVTLNGVEIAGSAPVQIILSAYTIAAFDNCGGHLNPFDGYHMHGATGCSELAVDDHAAIFGYALDGYGIYSALDEAGQAPMDLDQCGGHTTDEIGYHYHASAAEENMVIGCFAGQTATGAAGNAPAGAAPERNEDAQAGGEGAGGEGAGGGRGGPDFSEAADALGITEAELIAALGGPPPDLDAAAATLGITVQELETVMPAPPGQAEGAPADEPGEEAAAATSVTVADDSQDITNAVLASTEATCSAYVGEYSSMITDVSTGTDFTGAFTVNSDGAACTFRSNSIPNHDAGENSRFATAIAENDLNVEVTTTPTLAATPTSLGMGASVVMLNGIKWEAYPAACFGVGNEPDGREAIGCGPDDIDNPWRYNIGSPLNNFGFDDYFAHVQPTGLYHYHSTPVVLYDLECEGTDVSPVIGFAADGFAVYGPCFMDDSGTIRAAQSGYELKQGVRSDVADYTTPYITGNVTSDEYDGQFIGDHEWVDSGDLDACNGMMVNGQYGYYVTGEYPYVLACYSGTASQSFR